ncbi:MAG: secretion protein HlyD [Planctomycetaceae bacterium]|jgi:HlyD family secretion protein|nr:secretion protein HlyD [Planctomycetaceae bacterium]
MIKKIVVILCLLLILFGGGYFVRQYWESTGQNISNDYLILYGNVEIRRVNLGFRVFGRISEILFEEGDVVKKGEIIARLDREPYEDTFAVALAQVEMARENYAKLEAGFRPQEIKQARATLNGRIANLNVLESDFKRAQQLVEDNVVTIQEFENTEAKRDEAIAQKKIAEENLNLLLEGYRKEDIAAAKSQLAEAKANLKKAETALKDTMLLCPNDGILLTRVEEVGSVVNAGQIIATISLKDIVWVYVYVSELQLGKLAPGLKAEIYTDTQPDKPYTGQIGYISPEAEFTPKNVETTELRTALVYRVRIIADNPDNGLRQGMPVTVRLLLNQ